MIIWLGLIDAFFVFLHMLCGLAEISIKYFKDRKRIKLYATDSSQYFAVVGSLLAIKVTDVLPFQETLYGERN